MKITVKQIADSTGVSSATVSRVLNGSHNVSTDVRERVLRCSRELGYHIRPGNRVKTIAVIVPSGTMIFFEGYLGMVLRALSGEIFARGYRLELIPFRDLELLNDKFVVGGIAIMFDDGFEKEWCSRMSLPLICINSISRHIDGVYSVFSNEMQGMKSAVDLLRQHGHSRIGLLLSGEPDNWCNRNRAQGFIANMADLASGSHCIACCNDPKLIYEPLGKLLHNQVTALICTGEAFGQAALFALRLYGRRIPEDLSLITHEFDGVSSFCLPQLTTIRQNFAEISEKAMNLLEELINGRMPPADLSVDYSLILRDSVGKPPPPTIE